MPAVFWVCLLMPIMYCLCVCAHMHMWGEDCQWTCTTNSHGFTTTATQLEQAHTQLDALRGVEYMICVEHFNW